MRRLVVHVDADRGIPSPPGPDASSAGLGGRRNRDGGRVASRLVGGWVSPLSLRAPHKRLGPTRA